jgi:hypothetical protein
MEADTLYYDPHDPAGLRVELDPGQIDFEDPGNGTPVMVCKDVYDEGRGRPVQYSSTLNCALGTGLLDGTPHGDLTLRDDELRWLDGREVNDAVEAMYDQAKAAT